MNERQHSNKNDCTGYEYTGLVVHKSIVHLMIMIDNNKNKNIK